MLFIALLANNLIGQKVMISLIDVMVYIVVILANL
jgi:hypothetical protein